MLELLPLNCEAVVFESHGCNPWLAKNGFSESRKATAFLEVILGKIGSQGVSRDDVS